MNILDNIVANKQIEITTKKKVFPLSKELINAVTKSNFLQSIIHSKRGDIGLIAEIKMKSPSAGQLGEFSQVISKVKEYEEAGADAISVVTDEKYFGGSLDLFNSIRQTVSLPLFRKDFIIDEYQIIESAVHKADALLLIARILSREDLVKFVDLSYQLGIEPVVEIYDTEDLEKALATSAHCIAVNSRNLQTFEINIKNAGDLGKKIPKDRFFIAFSGVKTRNDVVMYQNADAKAVLVGTELMKSENAGKIIHSLKGDH